MKLLTFILFNFIVSCLSDIALNDLASDKIHNKIEIIASLKPYFANKTIIYSAILAGLTVITVLTINIIICKLIFNILNPKNYKELAKFLIVGFPLAYIADIVIFKSKLFGNSLNNYYKLAGAGLWGAIAYLFSVIISFILQKNVLPIL